MGLDALVKALEENPGLEATTETLLPFVDGPEFFEGFLRSKGHSLIANLKNRLYENDGSLLGVIQKRKAQFLEYLRTKYNKSNIDELTLDDIKKNYALATALGVHNSHKTIAAALVEQGLMSPVLPQDHAISKSSRPSSYIDADIVGAEQAKANLRQHVQCIYTTLDDINLNQALATALGIDKSHKSIAAALVEQGLMSSLLPQGHTIGRPGGSSWYINADIVGAEQAMANLRQYVQCTYDTLDDIKEDQALATALKVRKRTTAIREKIAELEWLDSTNFRPYAEFSLPASYRRAPIKPLKQTKLRPIGETARQRFHNTTLFTKGETFEQLFGLFLAYSSPDDLVIPQYCLHVTDDYFGTRVDFRVANSVYEVKWGNAVANIRDTYSKHSTLLQRPENRNLDYHLVRLEDGDDIDVPHQMFSDLLDKSISEARVKEYFEKLADLIKEAAEKETDIKEIEFLTLLRDFMYQKLDEANQKRSDGRKGFITGTLGEVTSLSREDLIEHLSKNIERSFAPLEAHFYQGSKLYRGFIHPKELEDEQPSRYQTIYYFGDVQFTSELDRNIAILIELSGQVRRIESILRKPNDLQDHPLFVMPSGLKISADGHSDAMNVGSLDRARDFLRIDQKTYSFALDYIQTNGREC